MTYRRCGSREVIYDSISPVYFKIISCPCGWDDDRSCITASRSCDRSIPCRDESTSIYRDIFETTNGEGGGTVVAGLRLDVGRIEVHVVGVGAIRTRRPIVAVGSLIVE